MVTFALMVCHVDIACIHRYLVGRNICHGSDSVESAEREISLWFKEGVTSYTSALKSQVYE